MTKAQDGGKFVSLTHRPFLPPGNVPGIHFYQRLIRPQGRSAIGTILCQWKIPKALAGIEPVTFWFVAQHLNHCATAVPECYLVVCTKHEAPHYSVFSSLLLTAHSRVLPQLLKQFPAVYGHRMFITTFMGARLLYRTLVKWFITSLKIRVKNSQHHTQPSKWRATPCQMSVPVYRYTVIPRLTKIIHSGIIFVSRNLR